MPRLAPIIRSAICLVMLLALPVQAAPWERTMLDANYRAELKQLADKCDELKLPEQAALTRAWSIERLPDRQYFFLPPERDLTAPKAGAPDLVKKWHAKFLELRTAQAEKLFAQAKSAANDNQPALAIALLFEMLREHPDHATARHMLGYQELNGAWRLPGASNAAKKATLAHSYLKSFTAGSYWRVSTPHFQVATSVSANAGLQLGEKLETLYLVWRQAFVNYWTDAAEVRAMFAGDAAPERVFKQHDVVLFKTRAEYTANLAAAEARLAVTQGIYLDKKQAAFFFQGHERADAICQHEVTHQLFQEAVGTAREVGDKSNFWMVEGIALYMESMRQYDDLGGGYVTLGGWDADRLQYARHHVFNGQFQMPLEKLAALGRDELQQDAEIKRLYSQSAGQAHYLMDGAAGRYREAAVKYLAAIYTGQDNADTLAKLTDIPFAQHDLAYRDFLQVSDEQVARLPSPERVKNLCLGHQAISDASLERIAQCEHLQWLDLAATKVTDVGLAKLAGLKALSQLNLEQTAAGDATLAWLGKHHDLIELDLSHTKVTDAGVKQLAGLRDLRVLWLTGTSVTDASVPVLTRLKELETLDLSGSQLSPDGLRQVKSALPNLEPEP